MKVKICGIKSAYEALNVANLGVDYLGVIFAPSPRKVDLQTAQEIAQIAHERAKKCVGVFAQISEDEIISICKNANLNVAQIYGSYSQQLREKLAFCDVEVWKVYSLNDTLPKLEKELFDMPLFDCKGAKLGGNGTSFDWEILHSLKDTKFILAGGIGADNIALAASFNPSILDLNSKVEDENGVKSAQKIKEALKQIGKI